MKYTLLPAVALAVLGLSCASHRPHHEAHQHGPACGHVALQHEGHTDYLHDGHLHHVHGAHADEHRLPVSAANPNQCTPDHSCAAHGRDHQHSSKCGHEAVPHGDHVDYLVGGHLHHPDGAHCDNHGAVQVAGKQPSAELIHSADARLYEAKHAGRNCCRVEETVQKAA